LAPTLSTVPDVLARANALIFPFGGAGAALALGSGAALALALGVTLAELTGSG
jgi:hypothetical protein